LLLKKGFSYRAFPIFFLAFFRVANAVIVDLAFPLYYAQINLNPDIIGYVIAARALTYLFSPILLKDLPKRIGKKNCLLISGVTTLFVTIGYEISLDPIACFVLRFVDGFTLGLFWPVLMASISTVCNLDGMKENDDKKDNLMKRYSIAWNLGGIISYLIGTIMLFFVEDIFLIFHIALIFAIIQFLSNFFYMEPRTESSEQDNNPNDKNPNRENQRENIQFPIFLPFFMVMVYAFILGAIGLIYPLKSEMLQYAIFTNYLFFFIRMVTQTIMLSKTMEFSINMIKKFLPYVTIAICVSLLIMGLNENLIVFGILFGIIGVLFSFLYLLSFKMVIFRDMVENTNKNSVYFEATVGMFFFFGPIIGGYIATVDINLAFYILSITGLGAFLVIMLVRKKIISRE